MKGSLRLRAAFRCFCGTVTLAFNMPRNHGCRCNRFANRGCRGTTALQNQINGFFLKQKPHEVS